MRAIKTGLFAAAVVAFHSPAVFAQLEVGGSLLDSCSQIDALRKSGDFAGARDKAMQCVEGLDQQIQGEIGKSFPTSVAGWTRTSIEQNAALGFNNISATYQKGETTAQVALTEGKPATPWEDCWAALRSSACSQGNRCASRGCPLRCSPTARSTLPLRTAAF